MAATETPVQPAVAEVNAAEVTTGLGFESGGSMAARRRRLELQRSKFLSTCTPLAERITKRTRQVSANGAASSAKPRSRSRKLAEDSDLVSGSSDSSDVSDHPEASEEPIPAITATAQDAQPAAPADEPPLTDPVPAEPIASETSAPESAVSKSVVSNVSPSLEQSESREASCLSVETSRSRPEFGAHMMCGRRNRMEDSVALFPSFTSVPCGSILGCQVAHEQGGAHMCQLHFFGVYDGHGGSEAAEHCSKYLHSALAHAIQACVQAGSPAAESGRAKWQAAVTSSFLRMDMEIGGTWGQGRCGAACQLAWCPHEGQGGPPVAPETVGSTSVVAVVGPRSIVVANAGDSRAVLGRAGACLPLSTDHKPDREDEMQRIESAGGRVIFWNGYRVLGVLAMSRAIGDRYLSPYVIPDPDMTVTERTPEDEFLVMASDGLWDVLSNEVACEVVRRCFAGVDGATAGIGDVAGENAATVAANVLCKMAFARGSEDNISVVVVDLRSR